MITYRDTACQPDANRTRSKHLVLIAGLGNPILGDDGAGWHVAEAIQENLAGKIHTNITVECFSLGGLSLMEQLVGYAKVILIDTVTSEEDPVGTVRVRRLNEFNNPNAGHSASVHDTTLLTALQVGRCTDIPLPEDDDIFVVSIESDQAYLFTRDLSTPITLAIPTAAARVKDLLETFTAGGQDDIP